MGWVLHSTAVAVVLHWVTLIIVLLSVSAHIWIRRFVIARPLGVPDKLIIGTALALTMNAALNTFFLTNSSRYRQKISDLANVRPEDKSLVTLVLKFAFALDLLYYFLMACLKWVFLSWYHRLMENLSSGMRQFLWLISLYVGTGFVVVELLQILWCYPVETNWEVDEAEFCTPFFSEGIFNYGYAYNITSDILVIVFPLVIAHQIRLAPREKVGVLFIVGVGFVSVAFSTLRFIMIYATTDNLNKQVIDGTMLSLLTTIEVTMGVFAACLPAFKSFYERVSLKERRLTLEYELARSSSNARKPPRDPDLSLLETNHRDSQEYMPIIMGSGPWEAAAMAS